MNCQYYGCSEQSRFIIPFEVDGIKLGEFHVCDEHKDELECFR